MVNRGSGVYCDGCGDSTGSLPHIPYVNNSHERPKFCIKKCAPYASKGIKTSEMVNFEWVSVLENIVDRRLDESSIGDHRPWRIDNNGEKYQGGNIEYPTLESFLKTMAHSPEHMPPDQLYKPGKLERMTVEEWRAISMMKFEGYKPIVENSDCSDNIDLKFLEEFLRKKDPYEKREFKGASITREAIYGKSDPLKKEPNLLKRKRILEFRKKN